MASLARRCAYITLSLARRCAYVTLSSPAGSGQPGGPVLPHVVPVGAGDVAVLHPVLDGATPPGGQCRGPRSLRTVHKVQAGECMPGRAT
eukprot:4016140-Pyramimonas_sp.AAC.1